MGKEECYSFICISFFIALKAGEETALTHALCLIIAFPVVDFVRLRTLSSNHNKH